MILIMEHLPAEIVITVGKKMTGVKGYGLLQPAVHCMRPSSSSPYATPGLSQASKGKQRMVFYTMPEYEAWKESLGGTTAGWSVKYYKVLVVHLPGLHADAQGSVHAGFRPKQPT